MAKLSAAPAFTHDCAKCQFLAHVRPVEGEAFDLYRTCEDGGSVLARTSSAGADYSSLPFSFAEHFAGKHRTTMERAFFIFDLLERIGRV